MPACYYLNNMQPTYAHQLSTCKHTEYPRSLYTQYLLPKKKKSTCWVWNKCTLANGRTRGRVRQHTAREDADKWCHKLRHSHPHTLILRCKHLLCFLLTQCNNYFLPPFKCSCYFFLYHHTSTHHSHTSQTLLPLLFFFLLAPASNVSLIQLQNKLPRHLCNLGKEWVTCRKRESFFPATVTRSTDKVTVPSRVNSSPWTASVTRWSNYSGDYSITAR